MYNHLPNNIKGLPFARFKIEVKEMLTMLVPYSIKEFFFLKIFEEPVT